MFTRLPRSLATYGPSLLLVVVVVLAIKPISFEIPSGPVTVEWVRFNAKPVQGEVRMRHTSSEYVDRIEGKIESRYAPIFSFFPHFYFFSRQIFCQMRINEDWQPPFANSGQYKKFNYWYNLSHTQIIHGVHLESEHVMKRRSLDQRLRVKIYYDTSVYKYTIK